MKVKSESEVAQSCPTLRHPMDCGPPGSSIHGNFQARVLEWGAIAFSIRKAETYAKNIEKGPVCVCVWGKRMLKATVLEEGIQNKRGKFM